MNIKYLFILICLTIILARGEIFVTVKSMLIRKLKGNLEDLIGTLIYCSMCLGFWVGLAGSFILDCSWIGYHPIINHISSAFMVSILSKAVDALLFEYFS